MLDRTLTTLAGLFICSHAFGHDLLDADVAFRTQARLVRPGLIEIRYDTAPGYYLYRDRLDYKLAPAPPASLGKPRLPPGRVKNDEFFGRSVIYRHRTVVRIPLTANGADTLTFTADLQGCADVGVCYPPVRRTFTFEPAATR